MVFFSGIKSLTTHWSMTISQRMADVATLEWLYLINPINIVIGSNRADVLGAKAQGDVVAGLGGNDALSSTFNRTALLGGDGNDKLTTKIVVPLQGAQDVHGLAIQSGDAGNDTLNAILSLRGGNVTLHDRDLTAKLFLSGGQGNDLISASANLVLPVSGNVTLENHILGGSGNDIIHAIADAHGALDNQVVKNCIAGGTGNDNITAQAKTEFNGSVAEAINVLSGGSGNDVLNASALGMSNATKLVSNTLYGGDGNDVLKAYNLTDSNSRAPVGINELWGGQGNDILKATHFTDGENTLTDVTNRLDGGEGNDNLSAVSTARGGFVTALNQLKGGEGNDALVTRLDADAHGGPGFPGRDLYHVSNVLDGGSGNDHLEAFLSVKTGFAAPDGSEAANRLYGGSGNDMLLATVERGSVGASFLDGGLGNDHLTVVGGSKNVLKGGDGNDILTGGVGNDTLMGGNGADRFDFALQNGHDTADFQKGKDIIDVKALAAIGIHHFGDLDIELTGGNSILHFDSSNDLTIAGVSNLGASDFWFA